MRRLIAIGLLIVSHNVRAANMVTWDLVESIRKVESGGRNVSGDNGMARGQWQFWAIAWKDVNQHRARQKLMTYSYDFAWKEKVSRVYAHDYLQLLRGRYVRRMKCEPNVNQLWAMWNVGYGRFFNTFGGDFEKCPHSTKINGLRIELLLKTMEGIR